MQIEDERDAMGRHHDSFFERNRSAIDWKWGIGVEFDTDNNIKAKGMSYLVEGMRRESFFLPRLRILDLTSGATTASSIHVDNKIKLEGVGYLVEMIQNNNFPNLEELSLISNDIRDEGLLKLVAMMRYGFLPHLKTIYLSDNKLRDESVKQLTAALAARKLAANAEIYLGCNKISSGVVQSLVSLLYLRPESQDPPLKYVVLEKSILALDGKNH